MDSNIFSIDSIVFEKLSRLKKKHPTLSKGEGTKKKRRVFRILGCRGRCSLTQVWGIPTATHMGTQHSTADWRSNEQHLPSRTEVMILTTLIALWARKGSFRYSADNKVFFCPVSHACQDANRVRTLPQPEVFSGKHRSLSLSLASLMVVSCPVKLWPSWLEKSGCCLNMG